MSLDLRAQSLTQCYYRVETQEKHSLPAPEDLRFCLDPPSGEFVVLYSEYVACQTCLLCRHCVCKAHHSIRLANFNVLRAAYQKSGLLLLGFLATSCTILLGRPVYHFCLTFLGFGVMNLEKIFAFVHAFLWVLCSSVGSLTRLSHCQESNVKVRIANKLHHQ